MLISHPKKFIFVHVYKVAGSSIKAALAEYCRLGLAHRITRRLSGLPLISSDFEHHVRPQEIQERIGERKFKRFFKFAFVRDPWDWQVSLYHYALERPTLARHELIRGMSGFDEYLEWRCDNHMCFQTSFTHDKEGNQLVDFIGRMEYMDRDFATVCKKIGVQASLPRRNTTEHEDFRKYYSKKSHDLVAEAYKDEIELLGYDFTFPRPKTYESPS